MTIIDGDLDTASTSEFRLTFIPSLANIWAHVTCIFTNIFAVRRRSLWLQFPTVLLFFNNLNWREYSIYDNFWYFPDSLSAAELNCENQHL